MLKHTIQVTLVSILGIGINFITQLLLAYYFGTTPERDAYFAAMAIPAYVALIFTGSLGMIFLPFLVKQKVGDKPGDSAGFISAAINFTFAVIAIIAGLSVLLARPIMDLFLPDSKQNLLENSVYLFRILIVSTIFTVMTNLMSAVFHARHSFLIPATAPVFASFLAMLSVAILSPALGIASIAWGTLAGALLAFLCTFGLMLKSMRYQWKIIFMRPEVKAMLIVALPLFLAGILFRSTTIIERLFAARLESGSLSYLGIGNQIIVILATVVSSGIATTSFPLLSKYWSEKDFDSLEKILLRVIKLIILIVFPLIVIFLVSGTDIIKIFFERGMFTEKDTIAVYFTLLALMGYFLFSSIGNVVARMMYVSQYTWAATIIGSAELLIYVVSTFILVKYYSYLGPAISLSVASAFNILVSVIFMRKKIIPFNVRDLLGTAMMIIILSVLVFLLVHFLNRYLLTGLNSLSRVAIDSAVVFILYWYCLRLIRPEFNKILMGMLKR